MAAGERIDSLDAIRGIAVLGILLMNIVGFGLPSAFEDPNIYGGATGADLAAWITTTLLFEGTMRGLFTLLFGAGVVLFTSKLEDAGRVDAADLHVRRMLWLIFFGFVNSHLLLWGGDILFEYGLVGLVLYAFRKTTPRVLLVLATLLLATVSLRGAYEAAGLEKLRFDAQQIELARKNGEQLTADDKDTLKEWQEELKEWKPPPEKLAKEIEQVRGSVDSAFERATAEARYSRTTFMYKWGFAESLGTMMIGIALFSLGALQGRWTLKQYGLLALGGYVIGLTVNLLEMRAILNSRFDPIVLAWTGFASYELGRIPMMLGHLGLILLLWKTGWLAAPFRVLAAVGRMAFTNYLAQSLIGLFVFTAAGFAMFGELARHQLYYVVVAIWVLQLIWSPLWLKSHRYGPLEWLWRSLTYQQRQPN